MGFWLLLAPLDVLWKRQERFLLMRGLAPQRNVMWERSVRVQGWSFISVTTLLVLIPILVMVFTPSPPSGVSINGRALTQAEWDGCNRDIQTCLLQGKGLR